MSIRMFAQDNIIVEKIDLSILAKGRVSSFYSPLKSWGN